MSTAKRVKLAVVGGHRGGAFDRALEVLQERVELTAICDLSQGVLARWKEEHPSIQTFTAYDDLLGKGDCTAVFIATPMQLHARQAVQALEAGKHVVSEVIAATTLDECWQLIETVEKTGLVYMLAENYCYMRPNMMVLNMAQQSVFGEITYAEGAYVHDCRDLNFNGKGEITWRGQLRRQVNGNMYPTHSLGPVAQWLGVNRKGGDRLVSTATWTSAARSAQRYVRDQMGADHPAAQDAFWKLGDSATTVIQTEKNAAIVLRMDSASARPHNMTHYVLQGTQAAYLSARHGREEPLIWIDGRSPDRKSVV
jgi:predicted dehydrogenase